MKIEIHGKIYDYWDYLRSHLIMYRIVKMVWFEDLGITTA
jgi:hypothetical protein